MKRRQALRRCIAAGAAWLGLPAWVQAQASVTDGSGRSVPVPRKVERTRARPGSRICLGEPGLLASRRGAVGPASSMPAASISSQGCRCSQ